MLKIIVGLKAGVRSYWEVAGKDKGDKGDSKGDSKDEQKEKS